MNSKENHFHVEDFVKYEEPDTHEVRFMRVSDPRDLVVRGFVYLELGNVERRTVAVDMLSFVAPAEYEHWVCRGDTQRRRSFAEDPITAVRLMARSESQVHLSSKPGPVTVHDSIEVDVTPEQHQRIIESMDYSSVELRTAQRVMVDIECARFAQDQPVRSENDLNVKYVDAVNVIEQSECAVKDVTAENKRFIGSVHYYAHEQRDVKEAVDHAIQIVRTFCANRGLDDLLLSGAIAYALLEAKGFPIDDLNDDLSMIDQLSEVADVLGEYDDWRTKTEDEDL